MIYVIKLNENDAIDMIVKYKYLAGCSPIEHCRLHYICNIMQLVDRQIKPVESHFWEINLQPRWRLEVNNISNFGNLLKVGLANANCEYDCKLIIDPYSMVITIVAGLR